MALQHKLRNTCVGIPELHAAVLGAREHPVAVRRERNAEDKVLVALERADTLAAGRVPGHKAWWRVQLPHLDGLVERATHEPVARRSKGNAVHAVLVAFLALEANDELAALDVPDAHALVERTGSHVEVIRGDGDGGNAILDLEVRNLAVGLEVPEADTAVARA